MHNYAYLDLRNRDMKDITAAKLGKEFGKTCRTIVQLSETTKTYEKKTVFNNMLHLARLEDLHTQYKVLDKFQYLNRPEKKKMTNASQNECRGTGRILSFFVALFILYFYFILSKRLYQARAPIGSHGIYFLIGSLLSKSRLSCSDNRDLRTEI